MLISQFLSPVIVEQVRTGVSNMSHVKYPFRLLQSNQPDRGCCPIFEMILCDSLVCLHRLKLVRIWSFLRRRSRRCFWPFSFSIWWSSIRQEVLQGGFWRDSCWQKSHRVRQKHQKEWIWDSYQESNLWRKKLDKDVRYCLPYKVYFLGFVLQPKQTTWPLRHYKRIAWYISPCSES